ncbi:MAG: glycoside hydrolase family 3 protein [Patescibacteria group bacterium]|nr:glycoside hydrolase family 3 protein [Patescibacteria group bacterium]
MNFNISRSNLMIILIIALSVIVVLIFIFLNQSSSPAIDEKRICHQTNLPYQNPALPIDERVTDLMSRMTDEEKIGQMVLIEKNSIHGTNDITKYNIGALLSGGGAGPKQETPLAWLMMINDFQSAAKDTCLGIPLLYGIDAIHGHGNVLGATIFPHAIGLGATKDPDLVKRVAKATADEMAATGIYWNYAPNLDVANDIRWGKTYETFGSNPENVAQLGVAYLEGMQDSPNGYFNVLANPKHFIGGGDMEYGTSRNKKFMVEEGNITIDENTLRQTHLIPFQKAIASKARVIMVGTATWQGKMNSDNHHLLTEILKNELGFSGFIVSDWYGVYQIESSKYNSLVRAVNAGIDMVMTPFDYKDFISNMLAALSSGDITKERIDDAVKRILTVKFETGLFDRPQAQPEGLSIIGNNQHREIAREAVRKSQVLLENKNSLLPLPKSLGKIIVAGSSADNLGRQAGGWTTEWQGIDGNYGIVGTTILEAIQNTVSKDTEIDYNKNGNFSITNNLADVGIVVVGEKPYAEGWGDTANPILSSEDLTAIEKVKAKSKKIVIIIVSGRPLDIKEHAKNWDAILATWLPGSEGQGVTDVLFGDYPFTGTLPVKWELN